MKVALVMHGNIWFCPYIFIYTKILDELCVSYDLISWNRDGQDKPQGIQYNKQITSKGRFGKLLPYMQYIWFIKSTIKRNKYDKLIIFGPQGAILLGSFLWKKYKGKYIFDYRDLSIEQNKLLKRRFRNVLGNSFANVISSPGFKKILPTDFMYLLSHNFDIDLVRSSIDKIVCNYTEDYNTIKILTIGGIRDYSSNIEVINNLSNKEGVAIYFVGKGHTSDMIKEYVKNNGINNVFFEGYYEKRDECNYINRCTFLNIFYPKKISHSTALSNRFYNALIYKKPMIVTSNSIQGDYVEKYKLGLSLENCNDIENRINRFLHEINWKQFSENCNSLLKDFMNDYAIFELKLKEFVNYK